MRSSKTIIGRAALFIIIAGAIGIIAWSPNPTKQNFPVSSSKQYTMADIALHHSEQSCWTTIAGKVYDLSAWVGQHPGGPEAILSICGIDATKNFMAQHGGQARPQNELAKFLIGDLTR